MSTLMFPKILWFFFAIGALKVSGRTSSCSGRWSAWSLCGYHEFGNLSYTSFWKPGSDATWSVLFLGKFTRTLDVSIPEAGLSFLHQGAVYLKQPGTQPVLLRWSKNYTSPGLGDLLRFPMILTFSWGDPYQSSLSARGRGAYMASGELKGHYIDILVRFSVPEATSSDTLSTFYARRVMAFHIPLTCLFIKDAMMPTQMHMGDSIESCAGQNYGLWCHSLRHHDLENRIM